MTRHSLPQPVDAPIEQAGSPLDSALQPAQLGYWPLGRPIPALLTDKQFASVLGLSEATFYRWKKAGRFRRFAVQPSLSPRHTRYSGDLVASYLRGQGSEARTFGGKRGAQQGVSKFHTGESAARLA